MSTLRQAAALIFGILLFSITTTVRADDRPIDGISDNSFLIEEAYNQEQGVIQHIFNAIYTNDSRQRGWAFSFTQEWPFFSEDHQLSFTILSSHIVDEGQKQNGIGDVLINYRYQALKEGDNIPAFAPRFSLILPTGSRDKGTGNGVVGYQWSLPFSKKVSSRFALHFNLGLTYLPKVRVPLDLPGSPLSPKRSLLSYNVGSSVIYAISSRVNLMLEWVGVSQQSLDDQGKRDREFKPILSPGIRAAVINKEDLQSVIGIGFPIGLNHATNNYGVFLYFSIEHKVF
jgi:Putative MetA-pathway of phenol degradation